MVNLKNHKATFEVTRTNFRPIHVVLLPVIFLLTCSFYRHYSIRASSSNLYRELYGDCHMPEALWKRLPLLSLKHGSIHRDLTKMRIGSYNSETFVLASAQ